MKPLNRRQLLLVTLLLLIGSMIFAACAGTSTDFQHQDQIATVPLGDPDFPKLGDYWVIDTKNVVSEGMKKTADTTLEDLKTKGFAEQAIVVMPGVKHGTEYAIQELRFLKLGNPDGPRANNGLLWLVITDAPVGSRIHYAVGMGLPKITTFETGPIVEAAGVYADQGDWDKTVETLANESAKMLKARYPELEPTPDATATATAAGGEQGGETDNSTTIWVIVGVVVAIIVIGIILTIIDPQLGALWFEFWLRVLAAALTKGGGGGSSRSGSGGGRSVRGR